MNSYYFGMPVIYFFGDVECCDIFNMFCHEKPDGRQHEISKRMVGLKMRKPKFENTRLLVSYQVLIKNDSRFEACVKKYMSLKTFVIGRQSLTWYGNDKDLKGHVFTVHASFGQFEEGIVYRLRL